MENLTSKEFEKVEKIKVTSAEIIVTGNADKPYFEIKYHCINNDECYIGYGSYDLKNVFSWLDECFDVV